MLGHWHCQATYNFAWSLLHNKAIRFISSCITKQQKLHDFGLILNDWSAIKLHHTNLCWQCCRPSDWDKGPVEHILPLVHNSNIVHGSIWTSIGIEERKNLRRWISAYDAWAITGRVLWYTEIWQRQTSGMIVQICKDPQNYFRTGCRFQAFFHCGH